MNEIDGYESARPGTPGYGSRKGMDAKRGNGSRILIELKLLIQRPIFAGVPRSFVPAYSFVPRSAV